ncbi:acyl-CoA dehydrogenase family protein [Mycobacterium kansasii]
MTGIASVESQASPSVDMDGAVGGGELILAAARAAAPSIRAAAAEIEESRKLPSSVVDLIRDVGVFRMSMPREVGGPEVHPVTQYEVIETIAAADGSAGWCCGINSESGYYVSRLDAEVALNMFPSIDIATGVMHVPTGRAEIVDGGYRITGRWNFCSGSTHSGWMVLGNAVYRDGEALLRADGSPEFVSAFVSSEQFEVIDTWDAMGLRGSGSNDVVVTDAFVPAERTFDVYNTHKSPPTATGPQYAFHGMFLYNHNAVVTGIARAAVENLTEIVATKHTVWGPLRDEDFARTALSEATALVESARSWCLDVLCDIYDTLARGDELSIKQRAEYRISMTHAHRASVEAVEVAFQAAGSTPTIRRPNVLERCPRDVRAANQHIIIAPKSYPVTGGMLLGEMPKDPLY